MTTRRKPGAPRGARGEFELIERLAARLPQGEGVVLGPGDDAAVLRPRAGRDLVATTDAFVEGVHGDLALLGARTFGARLAAANLSDMAAMAAEPRWALLSAGLAPGAGERAMEALQQGLAEALARHGASLVGGNLARARGASWWSLTLLGEVERGRAWTRFGARPGDRLAVTGFPGRSGAAIRVGAAALETPFAAAACGPLWRAYAEPPVRVACARTLAATGAVTAAIDVSDGFAGDLAHLCEASGVGVQVDEAALPDDPALAEAARLLLFQRAQGPAWRRETRAWAAFRPAAVRSAPLLRALRFAASDDYELLLAVDPAGEHDCLEAARATGTPLAFVGRFTDAPGVLLLRGAAGEAARLPGGGWDHLRGRGPKGRP